MFDKSDYITSISYYTKHKNAVGSERHYMPEGRLVYFDLDVVITGDLSQMIHDYRGDYCGGEDHVHFGHGEFGSGQKHPEFGPIDCGLGTAFVSMRAGRLIQVWETYLERRHEIERVFHRHGDQVFTSWALGGKFDLWERLYPDTHGICSYRLDLQAKGLDPQKQRIVNFHGHPKPHELVGKLDWLDAVYGLNR